MITIILLCLCFKQCRLQKADEALADAEKALEQSSQPTYLAAIAKGKALYLQGEFERSLIYVAQAEKMHPSAEARRLFFKSTEVDIFAGYQIPLNKLLVLTQAILNIVGGHVLQFDETLVRAAISAPLPPSSHHVSAEHQFWLGLSSVSPLEGSGAVISESAADWLNIMHTRDKFWSEAGQQNTGRQASRGKHLVKTKRKHG